MESADEVFTRRIGETVGGRWRLERWLGAGGMASVYAATDGERIAAVKLLHAEMSLRTDVRERFVREGCVPNLIDHPGAVRILEYGAAQDESFLAMELLSGESLGDRVRRHGGLPIPDLLDYLDQILDVLAAAHDKNVIHRDLKPDNLFVTPDGRVKVLDFGLARLLDDVPGSFKTRTGLALGTLPYMAPEQALGRREDIDGRVDLFALGATAFRILSGRKVHEAPSEAELLMAMASKPAPALVAVAPHVPADVGAIVDLALAFSKHARYPNARTMQEDVRAVRRGERPQHALARLSSRDEATRADRAAPALGAVVLDAATTNTAVAVPAPVVARGPTEAADPHDAASAIAGVTSAALPAPTAAFASGGAVAATTIAGNGGVVAHSKGGELARAETGSALSSHGGIGKRKVAWLAAAALLLLTAIAWYSLPSRADKGVMAENSAAPVESAKAPPVASTEGSDQPRAVAADMATAAPKRRSKPVQRSGTASGRVTQQTEPGKAKISGPGFEISTSFSLPGAASDKNGKWRDKKSRD